MERNEIKLRRDLSPGDIHRHRDYTVLMKRHKRSKLFKRTFRLFFYSLIVTFVVLILIMISWYVIQLKKKPAPLADDVRTAHALLKKN